MSTMQAAAAAPSISKVVSIEVRVLLARRELPANALSPVLGISTQAVSKKMRGQAAWSLDDLDVLAKFFGVDANALLPGLGKQGADEGLRGLPHLDSNQEPAGYLKLSATRGTSVPGWRWPLAQRAHADRVA